MPETTETLERQMLTHFRQLNEQQQQQVSAYVEALSKDLSSASKAEDPEPDQAEEAKPFWQEILEISKSIPEKAWDAIPPDLGENHDHYLYGAPKQ